MKPTVATRKSRQISREKTQSQLGVKPRSLIVPNVTTVPVIVQNGRTNPVPIRPEGNTSITGNVSISNTPNVSVVAIPSVYVNAVALKAQFSVPDGADYSQGKLQDDTGATYTVPAGKRLVFESVSGVFDMPCGQTPWLFAFWQQQAGVVGAGHCLAPQLGAAGVSGTWDKYLIDDRKIAAFVDQGNVIFVSLNRTGSTGRADVNMAFSGYLIDVS